MNGNALATAPEKTGETENKERSRLANIFPAIAPLVGLAALVLVLCITVGWIDSSKVKADDITKLLFVALVAFAAPAISKLSFGKDGIIVELDRLKTEVRSVEQTVGEVRSKVADVSGQVAKVDEMGKTFHTATRELRTVVANGVGLLPGGTPPAIVNKLRNAGAPAVSADSPEQPVEGGDAEDPWRGKFGGEAVHGNLTLDATVKRSAVNPDWFNLDLVVRSLDDAKPLTGTVTFYLHPTFQPKIQRVQVEQGKARLRLLSYGAFTVGAEIDAQGIRLERNLAALSDAPDEFRKR